MHFKMGADTSLILLRDMSDTPHASNDLNKLSTQFTCLGHGEDNLTLKIDIWRRITKTLFANHCSLVPFLLGDT
jgi:hypothetical protein